MSVAAATIAGGILASLFGMDRVVTVPLIAFYVILDKPAASDTASIFVLVRKL